MARVDGAEIHHLTVTETNSTDTSAVTEGASAQDFADITASFRWNTTVPPLRRTSVKGRIQRNVPGKPDATATISAFYDDAAGLEKYLRSTDGSLKLDDTFAIYSEFGGTEASPAKTFKMIGTLASLSEGVDGETGDTTLDIEFRLAGDQEPLVS